MLSVYCLLRVQSYQPFADLGEAIATKKGQLPPLRIKVLLCTSTVMGNGNVMIEFRVE
ncbi:hypothetical protein GCM10027577_28090 [Spirosoma fluminis]